MTKHDTAPSGLNRQADALSYEDIPKVFGDAGVATNNEPSELPQCVSDGIAKMHERWNNRLVWNSLDIAKEYACGRLEVVIAVDVLAGFGLNEAPSIATGVESDVFALPPLFGGSIEKLDPFHADGLSDRQQNCVLLCVVELAKPVEEFPGAARIECELDKEVGGVLPGCFYSVAGGFKVDPVIACRKLRVAIPSALVVSDKLPSSMIQRRPQIVDGVTQNQRQRFWQGGVKDDFESDWAVFVGVDVNSVTVRLGKRLESRLKVLDVLIGPFDL